MVSTRVRRNVIAVAGAAVLVFALGSAACGDDSSSSSSNSAAPTSAATTSSGGATSPTKAAVSTTAGSAGTPAQLDVCALLTADDAKAAVAAIGTSGTVTFTATNDPGNGTYGACKFTFNGALPGTIGISATAANDITLYRSTGTPIAGLGDEGLKSGGTVYVRVGKYMLSVGENSFSKAFEIELFKRMAPKVK